MVKNRERDCPYAGPEVENVHLGLGFWGTCVSVSNYSGLLDWKLACGPLDAGYTVPTKRKYTLKTEGGQVKTKGCATHSIELV